MASGQGGTGSDTAVRNFTFHPLLLSSSGIKKLQLDKGFEPKVISALLCVVSPGPRWRCQGDLGFSVLCPDPDVRHWVHSSFAFSRPQSLEFGDLKFLLSISETERAAP